MRAPRVCRPPGGRDGQKLGHTLTAREYCLVLRAPCGIFRGSAAAYWIGTARSSAIHRCLSLAGCNFFSATFDALSFQIKATRRPHQLDRSPLICIRYTWVMSINGYLPIWLLLSSRWCFRAARGVEYFLLFPFPT